MDELNLIQAARQGDLGAFNQLVLKYQEAVYNQALWILRERPAAEDFTQETFLKAYQHLNRFQGGSLRAWLLRIVTNACLDELRQRRRHPAHPLSGVDDCGEEIEGEDWLMDPGASVEEIAEQAELRASLQRAIDELPEEFRRTILLVDVMEMGYAEAAETMGVPIGTVKSRLVRARLQVQNRLRRLDFLPVPVLELA